MQRAAGNDQVIEAAALQRFAGALLQNEDAVKRMEAGTPVRRIGQPDDIAGVALFLGSDASNFITGQTFVVDGGQRIRMI